MEVVRDIVYRTDRTVLVMITKITFSAVASVGALHVAVLCIVSLCGVSVITRFLHFQSKDTYHELLLETKSVVALVLAQALVTLIKEQFPMSTSAGLIAATALLSCAGTIPQQVVNGADFQWLARVIATVKYIYSDNISNNDLFTLFQTSSLIASSIAVAVGAQIWRNTFGLAYVLGALSMVAVNATIDAVLGTENTTGNYVTRSPLVLLLVLVLDTASRGAVSDGSVLGELRGFGSFRAGQVFQTLMFLVARASERPVMIFDGVRADVFPMLLALILSVLCETMHFAMAPVITDVVVSGITFMAGDLLQNLLSGMQLAERVFIITAVLLLLFMFKKITVLDLHKS